MRYRHESSEPRDDVKIGKGLMSARDWLITYDVLAQGIRSEDIFL
jgi:hypothetical protein